MLDLKQLKSSLEQLEEERHISRDKIIGAIEDALTAAYKKDYGKKGQIIRVKIDLDSGKMDFYQIKIVVDKDSVRLEETEDTGDETNEDNEKPRYNEEHHLWLEDAQKIKKEVKVGDEISFPLETKEDYGRIAAQTAKQVIIQRLREAEKYSILDEYQDREGEILNGKVQKVERGLVFIDLGRATGIISYEDQIPGEYYRQGERVKAYLYAVEETPRGISLRLSRSHPLFIKKLFEMESPEIAGGSVIIKEIAREAGSRTKIAVLSNESGVDAVGSCVGQKGSRVSTIISELGGEKIDIIEWSDNPVNYISNALSPAKIHHVDLDETNRSARIEVGDDQFSLAVGKGGQNARLAAKLTGWKIDIIPPAGLTEKKEADDLTEGLVDDASDEDIVTPKEQIVDEEE